MSGTVQVSAVLGSTKVTPDLGHRPPTGPLRATGRDLRGQRGGGRDVGRQAGSKHLPIGNPGTSVTPASRAVGTAAADRDCLDNGTAVCILCL